MKVKLLLEKTRSSSRRCGFRTHSHKCRITCRIQAQFFIEFAIEVFESLKFLTTMKSLYLHDHLFLARRFGKLCFFSQMEVGFHCKKIIQAFIGQARARKNLNENMNVTSEYLSHRPQLGIIFGRCFGMPLMVRSCKILRM